MTEEAGKLENFLPLKGSSENESQEKMSHRRRPRRSSIGAIDTTVVSTQDEEFFTPENENINETYNQFAEQRVSPIRRVPERRSSFTKFETEMMLRHSLTSMNADYESQRGNFQKLKQRFERRGSVMTSTRSSHSIRSSMIGSVVETNSSDDFISCSQGGLSVGSHTTPDGKDSSSIPLSEVQHTKYRLRRSRKDMERDQLIQSLVNFSAHTSISVLEDLVSHEILCREYDVETKDSDVDSSTISSASFSSLSSGESESIADKGADSLIQVESHILSKPFVNNRSSLPIPTERESALLFVDITGFTKLSTVLENESLSKVINSYFEMIVQEVILYGGDILKFAGDAFFAEWRQSNSGTIAPKSGKGKLSVLVWQAASCAASIVEKFSDFHVSVDSTFTGNNLGPDEEATLDVHCGIGAGRMVGVHVSDFQEDVEGNDENTVGEIRREFIALGDAINQVSRAAHLASNGEVMASPEALHFLSASCSIPQEMMNSLKPLCIASKSRCFVSLHPFNEDLLKLIPDKRKEEFPSYQSIRSHCSQLRHASLSRIHSQMAQYVHPVVRDEELRRSKSGTEDVLTNRRHLAEAQLRSVYTMFINALVPPVLIGDPKVDSILFKTLQEIMLVTSRELDRYSGQLRQFIVDDKGVVLIATFGLPGSTFPNLVTNNALPATLSIHKALKEELGVDNRIGATFGQVYCGVVGGAWRHEFSVLGAPVNLAARLMTCSINNGILVNEEVQSQTDARFEFRSLNPIKTKGYDKPVPTLEPLRATQSSSRKRSSYQIKLTGRQEEKEEILGFAKEILDNTVSESSVIGLIGESGIGKSALGLSVMKEVKIECLRRKMNVINLRSTSRESEQRIPLCAFRKILLGAIKQLCEFDGSIALNDDRNETDKSYSSEATSESASDAESTESFDRSKDSYTALHSPRSRKKKLARSSTRSSLRVSEQKKGRRSLRSYFKQQNSIRRSSKNKRLALNRENSFESLSELQSFGIPYLEKLMWACEEAGLSTQYADLVGSRFLGLESARPVTHIQGRVPSVSELADILALAFMSISGFADLVFVFIDDFQWVDSFTWKVIQALGERGKKMILVCAMRSHDKQAMRRMSTAVNFRLEITLGPLELRDIRQLIPSVLGCSESAVDDHLCEEIYQMTGGLPVYVVELLEDLKRKNTLSTSKEGMLRLSEEQLARREKGNNALVEALLNRFDSLDARARKILQTCAVLGNSFAYSDLIRVHRSMDEMEIEQSLEVATNEMILIEILEDDEEVRSVISSSTGESSSRIASSIDYSRTTTTTAGFHTVGDRYFEFSHDMWRSNVLKTMLKGRKIELHRQIAEAMEMDLAVMLRRNDIARLLTLFDHWKSCGGTYTRFYVSVESKLNSVAHTFLLKDFRRAAPLSLSVGSRLNEWDLQAQSTDLYRDTLDFCYESVDPVDEKFRRLDGK